MGQSNCDLNRIFGDLATQVPDGPPGERSFVFHAGVLPEPPACLSTDRIFFRKSYHGYNGWHRADAVWMYLSAKKCRELGLFLLASGFHGPRCATTLSLTNPHSAIRRIRIFESGLRPDAPPIGLSWKPFALNYSPSETKKHPWLDSSVEHLPILALSNAEDSVGVTDQDWANRDTIWIPPDAGMFRLAELLLNAGCSWNKVTEYALEGDAGFRGVGPMSAELKICLPGDFAWGFSGDDIPDPDDARAYDFH